MSETRIITCDGCGADLTYTGNCEDYYLVVGNASKSPWYEKNGRRGGVVTSMAISPPLSRTHHFCGFACFDKWREPARLEDIARREKAAARKKWREENGVSGIIATSSYPKELQWPPSPKS